ncbi:MAG: B12-binding domain-containing radical SAM protein [Candidatus Hydrogenedentes bacterium]|nr:B12-binding domain-containing radical SAM protein [Candidatus Hydrogenedentota bacterium]
MASSRHVTLVRPPVVVNAMTMNQGPGSPPLSLACLSAVLKRSGYRVTAIDAFGESTTRLTQIEQWPFYGCGLTTEEIIARIPADTCLIGVSCMFSNEWLCHKRVINAIAERFPGIPIIVGGEHATAAPDYVLRSCPGVLACVLGEGEDTLLDLLDAIESGRSLDTVAGLLYRPASGADFVRTGPRARIRKLDELPWPDWDEIPLDKYLASGVGMGVVHGRNMPMLASRGCPYKCTFCSNPQMWGKLWNVRSVEDVVAEMKHYKQKYDVDSFSFYDLTAIVRRDWVVEFVRLLNEERMNIRWYMPIGTRSEALTPEIVAQLRASGCITLVFAPESGSEITLQRIQKKVDLEKMVTSLRACRREGVFSKVHVIVGFPGETWTEILKSMRFIVRLAWVGVNDVAVYAFVPYPGSVFYEELKTTKGFPAEGDPFDLFLAYSCNNNYAGVCSWDENLTDLQLRLLCMGASLMFYMIEFLLRPWRLGATCYRLVTGRPITLLERMIATLARRNVHILLSKLRLTGLHTRWKTPRERLNTR